MASDSPIIFTLWMECLHELYAQAKERKEIEVKFADVDALVVEKSKAITAYRIGENEWHGVDPKTI